MIFEFLRFCGRPVWEVTAADADRFLVHQGKRLGRARSTVGGKARTLAQFYDSGLDNNGTVSGDSGL